MTNLLSHNNVNVFQKMVGVGLRKYQSTTRRSNKMKKKTAVTITASLIGALLLTGCDSGSQSAVSEESESGVAQEQTQEKVKARTVITTDGEVDDMNSMLRYFLYANEMELEGIVLTSSMYHYAGDEEAGIEPFRWNGTDRLSNMTDAYEEP